MIIKQIWTGNRYRNFNYLIVCEETGEALAIDPCDYRKCLICADENGWKIAQVLNTHEHPDHISGNQPVIKITGARLLAHHDAGSRIKGIDRGLSDGDLVPVGRSIRLRVLDTPGHTMCHICLLAETDPPALFSGDTLFNAGVGHCKSGGDPVSLFETVSTRFSKMSDDTQIYPGHDYLVTNLKFTLDRERDNERAWELLQELEGFYDPHQALVTTLGQEREINTFLRLTSRTLIAQLRETFPRLAKDPSPQEVFLKLRELRDGW